MTHDETYLRTEEERRADWVRVEQISPDTREVWARLVTTEDEVRQLRVKLYDREQRIGRLLRELSLRDAP